METVWDGFKMFIGFFIAVVVISAVIAGIAVGVEEMAMMKKRKRAKEIKRHAKRNRKS